jgi:hypothetical protein
MTVLSMARTLGRYTVKSMAHFKTKRANGYFMHTTEYEEKSSIGHPSRPDTKEAQFKSNSYRSKHLPQHRAYTTHLNCDSRGWNNA